MPPEGCQAELIKFKTSQPSRQSLNTSDWPEILHGLLIYYSEPEKQRKKWFWTPFIFSIRPTSDSIEQEYIKAREHSYMHICRYKIWYAFWDFGNYIIPYYSFKVSELFLDVVLLTDTQTVSRTTSRNNSDTLKE